MLIHVAVVILINATICLKYCDFAETLLVKFVQELPTLYSESYLIYTV